MATKIINLTPHAVNIVGEGGEEILTVAPSGTIARCSASTVSAGEVTIADGKVIPITRTSLGEVTDIPEPAEDTIFIVSRVVAEALPDRDDLFIPNEAVRNDAGQIIGCRSIGIV